MSINTTIHPESLEALLKFTNKNTLLPKLAARLIRCEMERSEAYK